MTFKTQSNILCEKVSKRQHNIINVTEMFVKMAAYRSRRRMQLCEIHATAKKCTCSTQWLECRTLHWDWSSWNLTDWEHDYMKL